MPGFWGRKQGTLGVWAIAENDNVCGKCWSANSWGADGGHIRCCGQGCYGFRSYSGSLLKSAKVSKTLLPHHSAPRLGSVCPLSGITTRAAATGRPCPVAAKPASCRFTRSVLPAFGQRGLTGRLRSRSTADQEHSGPPAGLSGVDQKQKQKRTRSKNVGAGLLAKVVNDDACFLDERAALTFFASKPAPTEKHLCFRSGPCPCFSHS